MNRRKDIQDELIELAPTLGGLSTSLPYSVPSGYFANLPNTILDRIQEAEATAGLVIFNKKDPYTVPAGYFDSLPLGILARVKAGTEDDARAEIDALSPLLAGISRKMPYTLPSGYFENLTAQPVANVAIPPARVISIKASRVFRYAVAAVVAGIIGIAAWIYVSQPADNINEVAGTNTAVSEQQLLSGIDGLSDAEIANFVEAGSPAYSIDNNATTGDLADLDGTLIFEEVSDEELERYIQSNQPAKEKFN